MSRINPKYPLIIKMNNSGLWRKYLMIPISPWKNLDALSYYYFKFKQSKLYNSLFNNKIYLFHRFNYYFVNEFNAYDRTKDNVHSIH